MLLLFFFFEEIESESKLGNNTEFFCAWISCQLEKKKFARYRHRNAFAKQRLEKCCHTMNRHAKTSAINEYYVCLGAQMLVSLHLCILYYSFFYCYCCCFNSMPRKKNEQSSEWERMKDSRFCVLDSCCLWPCDCSRFAIRIISGNVRWTRIVYCVDLVALV